MDVTEDWVYDIETYKSAFTFSIVRGDGKFKSTFECSHRMNQIDRIKECMKFLSFNACRMVGFNNIGFDYPVLHKLLNGHLPKTGAGIASRVHKLAQEQIASYADGFGNSVKTQDEMVRQVDLFRIHHMNNKAKATSLKMIEFNMRNATIEDLPFDIEAELTDSEIDTLKQYNEHDVECTRKFYMETSSQLQFRDDLSIKLSTEDIPQDFTNDDDTKIGAKYFQMMLERSGVKLYKFVDGKRHMNQTKRDKIKIKECLFDYYDFQRPETKAIHKWFSEQVITETKGVFSDIEEHNLGEVAKYSELVIKRKKFKTKPSDQELKEFYSLHPLGWVDIEELKATEYLFDSEGNHLMEYPLDTDGSPDLSKKMKKSRVPKKSYWGCYRVAETLNIVLDGLRIDFGVGGIHASLSEKLVTETSKYSLTDADVSSMYPNIAISNEVYPEHLGKQFCVIYKDMYEQRKSYGKGTAENAMLKLALNGTYGKSNDKFSVFYDPKFTITITINGQLSLLLLAEKLLGINGLKLVQLNTDGVTVAMLRNTRGMYDAICSVWQDQVKLQLEFVDYSKMFIRDVNNYIAVYTNGKVKRKGAYQYEDLGWHQNQGGLVVPKAAEAYMTKGIPIEDFIRNHEDKFDFFLRTKVPRNSKLILRYEDRDEKQQNICRYYVANNGGKLIKIMPPLEGSDGDRELSIDGQWLVKTCNNIVDFDSDLNYNYYIAEANKLIITKEPKCKVSS